jgi:hypothetical protein
MKDIIEDPARWSRNAAGTPARAVGTLGCHLALVVLGYLLDQQALMVVAGSFCRRDTSTPCIGW